jgi:hypothetical protein
MLYSDGLVERRRESISVGLARLEVAARTLVDAPIDELCERRMAELTTASTKRRRRGASLFTLQSRDHERLSAPDSGRSARAGARARGIAAG